MRNANKCILVEKCAHINNVALGILVEVQKNECYSHSVTTTSVDQNQSGFVTFQQVQPTSSRPRFIHTYLEGKSHVSPLPRVAIWGYNMHERVLLIF